MRRGTVHHCMKSSNLRPASFCTPQAGVAHASGAGSTRQCCKPFGARAAGGSEGGGEQGSGAGSHPVELETRHEVVNRLLILERALAFPKEIQNLEDFVTIEAAVAVLVDEVEDVSEEARLLFSDEAVLHHLLHLVHKRLPLLPPHLGCTQSLPATSLLACVCGSSSVVGGGTRPLALHQAQYKANVSFCKLQPAAARAALELCCLMLRVGPSQVRQSPQAQAQSRPKSQRVGQG